MRAFRYALLPVALLVAFALDWFEWRRTRREAQQNQWLQRVREMDGLDEGY